MAFLLHEGAEPIAGYRLMKKIGTGGYGEVWMVTAPGGLTKAIKVIYGHMSDARAEQELRALSRIREVRHPFLLSLERFEFIADQLFIVTELADASLMERFDECREAGLIGIPRDELLGYFRDAADALDYMNSQYALQHLDIKPQNLLLVAGRIKIADFGLVKDLYGTSATATGGVTPIYASPEAFDGKVSRFSDQYSLAIVFQEMLTGIRPFPGKTALHLAAQHLNSPPLLDPLSPADRLAVGRSLSKTPDQRYPTCRALVDDLFKNLPPAAGPAPAGPLLSVKPRPPVEVKVAASPGAAVALSEEELLAQDTIIGTELDAQLSHLARTPDPEKRQTPLLEPWAAAAAEKRHEEVLARVGRSRPAIGLRPTLFLGVGGLAGWALRRLRQRLHYRFGNLQAVPVLRLLLLDTDRGGLRLAQQGEAGEGLRGDETLALPLRKPEHYKPASREILPWLKGLLYNIPRSLQTEGYRPYGRLALVTNAAEVLGRLREALSQLTGPAARAAAQAATGLPLRDEVPRIFLVAGVSGGTGGGMALDLAYLVRQALADLHLPDDGVCGVLLHATPDDTKRAILARSNAFATLLELNHFSRPDAAYPGDAFHKVARFGPGVAPLPDCYLVHLGDRLGEAEADAATDALAEYLFLDAASAAGGFLDAYRQGTRSDPSAAEGPWLRTFGLSRLGFPRYPLADLASRHLCRHVLGRWQGDGPGQATASKSKKGEEEERARAEVLQQASRCGLEIEELATRLRAAAQAVWGADAEAFFLQELASAVPDDAAYAGIGPAELAERVLTRLDEVLGRGGKHRDVVAPFETALRVRGAGLTAELGRPIIDWLLAVVEDPRRRFRAAEAAADTLIRHLLALAEMARSQVPACRSAREALRQRLDAGDLGAKSAGTRWLGRGRRPALGDEARQKFLDYCWLRLKEAVLEGTVDVLGGVDRELSDLHKALANGRQRLGDFAVSFRSAQEAENGTAPPPDPGVTPYLPAGTPTLSAAADAVLKTLPAELIASFDERFQKEILAPRGGLWGVVSGLRDLEGFLREELHIRAQAAVLEALQGTDAAQLFLAAHPQTEAAEALLRKQLEAATPRLPDSGSWQHLLIARPSSPAGATLDEMTKRALADVKKTVVDSDGDVVFCLEKTHLPLAQVAYTLIDHESTYTELARKMTTRVDVAWAPLE